MRGGGGHGAADVAAVDAAAVESTVVAGTDASDFGCGQTVWIDGRRSEARIIVVTRLF